MEIRAPLDSEKDKLKAIWEICFKNDTDEDIACYFNNAYKAENTLVYICDNEPVGMISVIPAILNTRTRIYKGGYIYAAATLPEHRKKGVMTALEKRAYKLAEDRGYDFLCVVPESCSLFSVYEKSGYVTKFYLAHRIISALDYKNQSTVTNLSFVSGEYYLKLRQYFLGSLDMSIRLDGYMSDYFNRYLDSNEYKGLLVQNKFGFGPVTYQKIGNRLLIREVGVSADCFYSAVWHIADLLCVDEIELYSSVDFGTNTAIHPYGMIKTIGDNISLPDGIQPYMNLMMD